LKCTKLTTSDACDSDGSDGRSDDCFWLYNKNLNEGDDDSGACRDKEDNTLSCGEAKRASQCVLSDVRNLNENCFWLYNSFIETDITGSCKNKTDNTLSCENAVRSSQCTLSDVTNFNDKCFWIYNESSFGNEGGDCYNVMDESLECSLVKRESQCTTDMLSETYLANKCIYLEGGCKWRCEEIKTESECSGTGTGERGGDCTWIYSAIDTSDKSGKCYPKNKTDIECEAITREDQCLKGGGFDKLKDDNEFIVTPEGTCDVYYYEGNEHSCKLKCSTFTSKEDCESTERSIDCVWLDENKTGNPTVGGKCINKVCLYIYII
jgi:hypothetical protein